MRRLFSVSLYAAALLILSCTFTQSKAAAFPVQNIIIASSDTVVLSPVDTVAVDDGYTLYHFADTGSLRFHFTVKNASGTMYRSADITSDFNISNGFIAYRDAKNTALILVARLKSSQSAPAINKQDLTDNEIPQQ